MARQIKETPILEGKDAEHFEEEVKRNENQKIPRAEYLRAVENFNRIKIVEKS